MIVDLHMHSNHSDGILSPAALMSRAKAQGVEVLALTDHDTISGLAQAHSAAKAEGLTLINGIEFSSQWGKIGVHIVGLGVDTGSASLQRAIRHQQRARRERNSEIAARLQKLGVSDALEQAQVLAGSAQVGRPHFAEVLVSAGKVKDSAAAFKKYLGSGKSCDIRNRWPLMADIIATISAAGGLAVLAHPAKYKLTGTKMRALVADFAACGGQALEIISGQQPAGLAAELVRLANQHQLYGSCGSDFHKPERPWQELGRFEALPAEARPVWQALLGSQSRSFDKL